MFKHKMLFLLLTLISVASFAQTQVQNALGGASTAMAGNYTAATPLAYKIGGFAVLGGLVIGIIQMATSHDRKPGAIALVVVAAGIIMVVGQLFVKTVFGM